MGTRVLQGIRCRQRSGGKTGLWGGQTPVWLESGARRTSGDGPTEQGPQGPNLQPIPTPHSTHQEMGPWASTQTLTHTLTLTLPPPTFSH